MSETGRGLFHYTVVLLAWGTKYKASPSFKGRQCSG